MNLSHSEWDTESLGAAFSALLQPGDTVWLCGGMGAGKTAFVRGLAKGLSVTETVSSPTFALVHEYRGGRLPLFHFDLFRLSGWDDFLDIGWDDYLSQGGICAVEWSQILAGGKPGYTVILNPAGETEREIVILNPDGNEAIL